MKAFFKLVRLPNLLLVVYVQVLIRFCLFPLFNFTPTLSFINFILLTLSIALITAAGYIINNIFDIQIDQINKPKEQIIDKYISLERSKTLYKLTNTTALLLAAILVLQVQKPTLFIIFLSTIYLLYLYSKKLKKYFLIGNILVAFLVGFTIPFQFFFEDLSQHYNLKISIGFLTFFAFNINLVREIIKDIEDVNGDKQFNLKTIPLLFGRKRALKVSAILLIPTIFLSIYLLINCYQINLFISIYFALLVFSLLAFIYYNMISLKNFNTIKKISLLLKLLMFFGVTTVFVSYIALN